MMDLTEKQTVLLKMIILPLMAALVNTSVGVTYILATKGFIPPPSLLGSELSAMANFRFLLVIVPLLSAMIVCAILAEHEFMNTFVGGLAIILESIILVFAFLLLIPQIIGNVAFVGGLAIFAQDVMLFVILPLAPTSFAGIFIGLVLGDRWMFTGHTAEDKVFREDMDDWFSFLENVESKRRKESDEALKSRDI